MLILLWVNSVGWNGLAHDDVENTADTSASTIQGYPPLSGDNTSFLSLHHLFGVHASMLPDDFGSCVANVTGCTYFLPRKGRVIVLFAGTICFYEHSLKILRLLSCPPLAVLLGFSFNGVLRPINPERHVRLVLNANWETVHLI